MGFVIGKNLTSQRFLKRVCKASKNVSELLLVLDLVSEPFVLGPPVIPCRGWLLGWLLGRLLGWLLGWLLVSISSSTFSTLHGRKGDLLLGWEFSDLRGDCASLISLLKVSPFKSMPRPSGILIDKVLTFASDNRSIDWCPNHIGCRTQTVSSSLQQNERSRNIDKYERSTGCSPSQTL